jgi:hypothetical protein
MNRKSHPADMYFVATLAIIIIVILAIVWK